ncbi:MAG: glycoside hydrolase family 2 [Lachnospiraceae bacterium]|nr:glycoside hydrolase family 2 [Lachnospiraceae bacterium]
MTRTWEDYPRPQFRRDSFLSLNGIWDFCDAKIRVPFCPESRLSGLGIRLEDDDIVFYHRTFEIPEGFMKGRLLLHFGAVDQVADVFVNGHFAGRHEGGYTHFTLDVTKAVRLSGENHLIVRVEDRLDDRVYPYGKQRHKRGGMWYTPVTGIWQSVWLESVPGRYIRDFSVTTKGNRVTVHVKPGGHRDQRDRESVVCFEGQRFVTEGQRVTFTVEDPVFWSPENPHIYGFKLFYGEDEVSSYFALRDLEIREIGGIPRLLMNGKPYFFHGLLDQGYYEGGIYTPETPERIREDILLAKSLGFNMLRKHIKVEPDIFYYLCDTLGMCVFQDMVNNGEYNYVRDTVLPNFQIRKDRSDRMMNPDPETRRVFLRACRETWNQLRNFPCIVYWTVFNEGWGQFRGDYCYAYMKKLDRTRFVDTASGWYNSVESDVFSDHVYFRPVAVVRTPKPYVLSEYGGYVWKIAGHGFSGKESYGYRDFRNRTEYEDALDACIRRDVLDNIDKGLCAAVLTQLSDVEDELNGFVTYDRAVVKVRAERFRALGDEIRGKMEQAAAQTTERRPGDGEVHEG